MQYIRRIQTPMGRFTVCFTEAGVNDVYFPNSGPNVNKTRPLPKTAEQIFKSCAVFFNTYFSKHNTRTAKLPTIDWRQFSAFQRNVYRALVRVPAGRTVSYQALARQSQRPRASRAVGSALKRNPIPIIIPCHRVVRSDGTLGGFNAGRAWKQKLLNFENSKTL